MKEKFDQLKNKVGDFQGKFLKMWKNIEKEDPPTESKNKLFLITLNGVNLIIFLISLGLYFSLAFKEGSIVNRSSWLIIFYFKVVKNLPLIALLAVILTYIFYDKKKIRWAFIATLMPYICIVFIIILLLLIRFIEGSGVFGAVWIF